MPPVAITLDDHYAGDTWIGIAAIGPVEFVVGEDPEAVEPPAELLARCDLQFRDGRDRLGYALSSVAADGVGTIEITDTATWEMRIVPQALPLAAGSWRWDLQTVDAAGTVLTLYAGTLVVLKDVTRDE
jgi:hypothetical protein